jgi:hypothetical protein
MTPQERASYSRAPRKWPRTKVRKEHRDYRPTERQGEILAREWELKLSSPAQSV